MKKGILLTIALATMALFTNAQDNIIPNGGGFDDNSVPGWFGTGTVVTTNSVDIGGGQTLTPHNGARFLFVQNSTTAVGTVFTSFATTERPSTFESGIASYPVQTDQYTITVRLSKWDMDSSKRDTIMLINLIGPAGTQSPWSVLQQDLTTFYRSAETPDSCFIYIRAGVHIQGTSLVGNPNSAVCFDGMKLNSNTVSIPIVFDETEKIYNYPNPVSGKTTISYGLNTASKVDVTVTDITGKHVATVFSGEQAAGRQEVEFDATALKPGIYFYTVKAGNAVETKKFVVTR